MTSGFKLILAASADGFLAKGDADDMKWTGRADKALFKMLTTSGGVLVGGRRTVEQMPPLQYRTLLPLSRDTNRGMTLDQAHAMFNRDLQSAWLIGGPTVALEALKRGMVSRVYLNRVPSALGDGIPVQPLLDLLPPKPTYLSEVDGVLAAVYLGVNGGPRG
jgi:dihydrofolate reductase